MKKTAVILSVILAAAGGALFAEEMAAANKPEISGRFRLFSSLYAADNPDGLFFTHEAGQFAFRRAEVRLKIAGSVNDRVSYGIRFDAFSYPGDLLDSGQFPESAFLGSPTSSEHFELALYEGWVKVGDFLLSGLDLTAGKQRISWGTADKVGVVDNLNPIDFANFLSFDPDYFFERRPQTGINLEYYPGGAWKIQLVGLLQHQVSPLPFGYAGLADKFFPMDSVAVEKGWDDTMLKTAWGIRVAARPARDRPRPVLLPGQPVAAVPAVVCFGFGTGFSGDILLSAGRNLGFGPGRRGCRYRILGRSGLCRSRGGRRSHRFSDLCRSEYRHV